MALQVWFQCVLVEALQQMCFGKTVDDILPVCGSQATCTKQLLEDLLEEGYLAAAMHAALAICDAHAAACRAVVWVKAAYLDAKGLQCFLHRVYKVCKLLSPIQQPFKAACAQFCMPLPTTALTNRTLSGVATITAPIRKSPLVARVFLIGPVMVATPDNIQLVTAVAG